MTVFKKAGMRGRFAAILEWQGVDKSLFLLLLLLPLYVQYLAWSFYVLSRQDRELLVHVDVVHQMVQLEFVLLCLGAALILFGLYLRKRQPENLTYQYVALQFYALTLVLMSYSIGTVSFCAGIVLLGAPVFGFIFMNRGAVWAGAVSALVALVALSYATVWGWLPYAPVMVAPTTMASNLFWMNSLFFFAAPFLLTLPFLADQMLLWWREREHRIHQLSRTDALTGLHNRRRILELLDELSQVCARQQVPLTVAILDLDHFKQVNDNWGHPVGDAVLKQAAQCLKDHVRAGDQVGRYGGEEFMVLLPSANAEDAQAVLNRCRQALTELRIDNGAGGQLSTSASFGATIHQANSTVDLHHSVLAADQALYQAKANGRNCVVMA
ncbi:MAG: GGDEF domain-containing protein [Moraxellaceae bacterium]|nr:GGDEF domain-containing protein [Moraxellaceae bacterium]MDZ4385948.1 GGDEF domain-containing protein [Moraxellaceae bacterium]